MYGSPALSVLFLKPSAAMAIAYARFMIGELKVIVNFEDRGNSAVGTILFSLQAYSTIH